MRRGRLFLLEMLFLLSSCFTGSARDPYTVIYKGQTNKVYDDSKDVEFYLTNEGFSFETINTDVLIRSKVIIEPFKSFKMTKTDYYATVNNFTYDEINKISGVITSREYNIKENGYDIFEKEISSKITYTFCFITPTINKDVAFIDENTCCIVYSLYTLTNKVEDNNTSA